jgi:hypothetical protein
MLSLAPEYNLRARENTLTSTFSHPISWKLSNNKHLTAFLMPQVSDRQFYNAFVPDLPQAKLPLSAFSQKWGTSFAELYECNA